MTEQESSPDSTMTSDRTSCDVWVQTRRRIDVILGTSLIAIAVVAIWTSWPEVWRGIPMLLLPACLWFVMRRSVPKEGRAYPAAEIAYQHKVILAVGSISLPWVLAILAVEWLQVSHPAWFYVAIFMVFFSLMLYVLGGLDKAHRVATNSDSSQPNQINT